MFAQRGIAVPAQAPRDDTLETLSARGADLLQALHRDGGNQGYASPDNLVTGALYPVAIQYAIRLWRNLVSPWPRSSPASTVLGGELYRTATGKPGPEVRAGGAKPRPRAHRGDRSSHPDRSVQRLRAGAQRAGGLERGSTARMTKVTRVIPSRTRGRQRLNTRWADLAKPNINSVAESATSMFRTEQLCWASFHSAPTYVRAQ